MNCDVCGQRILGNPAKVIIEGAKVAVCRQCATLGKPYVEPPSRRMQQRVSAPRYGSRSTRSISRQSVDDYEVVENPGAKIREAREKMGLTQQDLARIAKERLSIIQKIESGKVVPDMRLCRELEHSLRIVLLSPRDEIPPSTVSTATPSLTLGDVVRVRRRVKEQ